MAASLGRAAAACATRRRCACARSTASRRRTSGPDCPAGRRRPGHAGTLPAVPPYYLTTPIYYVNDAPHVGTAYTTVNADALARWHRLLGDDVWFMTGTDEHGAKIVEAAEANGTTPQEWTDRTSARFVEAWRAPRHLQRRLHPHHRAPPLHGGAGVPAADLRQRVHRAGLLLGPLLRLLRGLLHRGPARGRQLPGARAPGGRDAGGQLLLQARARSSSGCSSTTTATPTSSGPISKRNEALGFIRGGLRDVSITRTSFTWGVPVPWDSGHVFYVWYDALDQLPDRRRLRRRRGRRSRARWGAAHHLIGKDILKFHCVWWPAMCMAAGIDPPAEIFVHGYLLMGGQKLGKTMIAAGLAGRPTARRPLKITDVSPLALADDFGVDPLRYHLLREVPLGGDGDFSFEGIVARYNADLANNLGNLVSRVTTVVHSKCGGVGPACDRDSALAAVAAARARGGVARPGPAGRRTRRSRRPGGSSARPTPSSRRPSPGRWSPGPAVDAVLGDALEVLRIVAVLVAPAMPSTAAEVWRRIGARGRPRRRPGCPATPPGAATPAGPPVVKGEPAVPAAQGLTWAGWFDSHCHVQEEYLDGGDGATPRPTLEPRPGPGAEAAGVDRLVCIGTGPATSRQAVALARRRRRRRVAAAGLGLHRAAPPRGERGGRRGGGAAGARAGARATAPWWRSASAGSTTTTSTRRATRSAPRSRRRSRWPTRTVSRW